MRRYRQNLAKIFYSRANVTNDLFELYGGKKHCSEYDNQGADKSCPMWLSALKSFASESYLNPHCVAPEVRNSTLHSFCSIAKIHKSINFRSNDRLWLLALQVFHYPKPSNTSSWENRFYCSFVLYRQQKFSHCFSFSRNELYQNYAGKLKHDFLGDLMCDELCFCLNFFSVYFMSSVQSQNLILPNELRYFKECLTAAKDLAYQKTQNQETIKRIIECSHLSIWSLEWAFRENKLPSKATLSRLELTSVFPRSFKEIIFSHDASKVEIESLQAMAEPSPWALHQAITDHCESSLALQYIFDFAQKAEKRNFLFTIYDLALKAGVSLLKNNFPSTTLNLISFLGTSLPPKLIALIGNTRQGYKDALALLTQMSGPEAYNALRKVLFHRPASEQRIHQEKNGDMLAPLHPDGQTWLEALQALHHSMISSDDSWHSKLPHTLRLVSDAGKSHLFFQLLANYDCGKNSQTNAMIASALGQIIRRSGTWWHATCVLELISTSSPPQHKQEIFFLRDACLQVLFALRSARKWEEAIQFYASLSSITPPQGLRWMTSVVCDLPSSAPWEKVLKLLQKDCDIPRKFLTLLRCIHSEEALPSDSHGRQRAIRCLVNHGQWKRLLSMHEIITNEKMWKLIFSAAHRCRSKLPQTFFTKIPREAFKSQEILQLSFAIAHENGIMMNFLENLKSLENSTTQEWYELARLFVTRTTAVSYRISSIAALRRLVEVVGGKKKNIYFESAEVDLYSKSATHMLNGIPKCFEMRRIDERKTVLLLRSPSSLDVSSQLICYSDTDVILASKPYGVDSYSFAHAVILALRSRLCFTCVVDIPSSAAGIILLLSPHIPTKWCQVTFTILAHIVPLLVGNSCSSSTPILACHFMGLYNATVLFAGRDDHSYPMTIQLHCKASLDCVRESLDKMRQDINAEGWDISSECDENDSEGICFLIQQVKVHYVTKSLERKNILASLEQPIRHN